MALTVEELQIVLSCDAKTAEAVLKQMDATVKAYTDKFQKYFQTKTGKAQGLDAVAKQIDGIGVKAERAARKAKKLIKSVNEYVPSGKKYVGGDENGRGGGMGDPNYFQNSPAFNMTFGGRTPNNEILEFGAQMRATLEESLSTAQNVSQAMRMKIGDALAKLRDLAKQYQDAVQEHGLGSKEATNAEAKFKNAIYAADKYEQQLERIIAKEREAQGDAASVGSGGGFFDSMTAKMPGLVSKLGAVGAAMKKAFNHTLLGKFLHRLSTVMMRMAAMKLIRGTIDGVKAGLEALSQKSASSAKAMNAIKGAGDAIKMSLGMALMPVVKALAPVFLALAKAVNTACNSIARFFAVLTGQSHYTAVGFSGDMDDVSSSVGGAGKAVKRAIAAFDELNIIGSQGGGGGGGGGLDTSMAPVEGDLPALSELADKIRKQIENGNWKGVGQVIADKINEGINDWDPTVSAKWISDKIKNALDVAIGFLETLDWFTLGEKLAIWLSNVDWTGIAERMAEGLGAALGGIVSTILGYVYGYFETAIQDLMGSIFDENGDIDLMGLLKALNSAVERLDPVKWAANHIAKPLVEGFMNTLLGEDTWTLVKAWVADIPAKAKNLGIKIANAIIKEAENGINDMIALYNDSLAAKVFGQVDPIHFELIPEIPPEELSKNYNEAKAQIEAKAAENPPEIEASVDVDLDIPSDTKVNVEANVQNPESLSDLREDITFMKQANGTTVKVKGSYTGTSTKTWSSVSSSVVKLDGVDEDMDIDVDVELSGTPVSEIQDASKAIKGLPKKKSSKASLSGTSADNWSKASKAMTSITALPDNMGFEFSAKMKEGTMKVLGDISTAIKAIPTSLEISVKVKAKLDTTDAIKDAVKGAFKTYVKYVLRGLGVPNNASWTLQTAAKGAIAYGETPLLVGEYAGARSNPEVIAPLSDLVGILQKTGHSGGGAASSDQIRLLEEQNRLLRAIAQKELTISPSVALGQVVARSNQLYART